MKNIIYWILSSLNVLIPKNKRMIAIYGRSMLNDNAEALMDFLISEKYYKKYQLLLLVRKGVKHDYNNHVTVVNGWLNTIFYTLRVKYLFHTHGMSLCKHIPCRSQIVFNLWHGSPLKAIGAMIGVKINPHVDSFFLCSSPLFAEVNKKCFLISDEQIFIGSNPRNDYLFKKTDVCIKMGWDKSLKVVVFMPTFRSSKGLQRHDASKDFPILSSSNISTVDEYLKKIGVLLVIKPHPYQDNIDFLRDEYQNIRVLYNDDVHKRGVRLYELLGNTDALITDFSSVYFDYLLTDKPIGFTIDDYESYSSNRGYALENPLEMMPGMKIKDLEGFMFFLKSVSMNKDDYAEERKRVNALSNTYTTPDASKRILEHCGIYMS